MSWTINKSGHPKPLQQEVGGIISNLTDYHEEFDQRCHSTPSSYLYYWLYRAIWNQLRTQHS